MSKGENLVANNGQMREFEVIMSFGWIYFKEMTKREILIGWKKPLCVKRVQPLCKGEFFLKGVFLAKLKNVFGFV